MSVDTAFVEGIAESEDVPMLAFAITNQRMIKTEQNTLEPERPSVESFGLRRGYACIYTIRVLVPFYNRYDAE